MGFLFKNKSENANGISKLDEILGYFDEVIKQRKEIEISLKKKTYSCGVYEVDDKKKALKIQDKDMNVYDRENAKCGFSLDSTWFSFNTTFLIIENKPYLLLPDEIIHEERRKQKRVSFTSRENAQVSILEGFGKGIGITGSILNISLSGICIEIDRAISIESEKEIRPQKNLIEEGKKLGLVRIKGIPMVSEIDITGITHEFRSGHKWNISIQLPKLNEDYKNDLERFIESRSREFTLIRRSRKKRLETEKKHKEDLKKNENEISKTQNLEEKMTSSVSKNIIEKDPQDKSLDNENFNSKEKKKNLIPILIVGKPLDRDLFFLRKFTNFEFFVAEDVPDLLKNLSEHSPDLLFIPHMLIDQNMINVLLKISQKGVLHHIRVFLFIEKIISENEILKCKALGIEGILTLPIKDPLVLIKKISKKA